MRDGGFVTVPADEFLALLDELADLEKRLRALGSKGFTTSDTTRPPSQASRKKGERTEAMELDLDILKVNWQRSKKAGGGPAGPQEGWAWAFALRQDGIVPPENRELIQALELYGTITAQGFEVSYGSDPKFLNRKREKK